MKTITKFLSIAIQLVAVLLVFACTGCSKKSDATITFHQQFDATLQPSVLQGFEISPTSSENCVYIAKICPWGSSTDGAHVQNYFIQPETDGKTWHDVIRIMLPPEATTPLKVHVVIYKISGGDEPATKVYSQKPPAEPEAWGM
jgi:hypothetical protein